MSEPAVPVFGHKAAVVELSRASSSGRLHHAWLVSGPTGVGKRTFAEAASLGLLVGASGPVPREHPAARFFRAGTHLDFHRLEREVWDGDEIVPLDKRTISSQLARSIRIEQVRRLSASLTQTGALSNRRAILIDAADDLEPPAANALLKLLEEPPAGATFFLVSHQPARLLPTIRSRCRELRLGPLEKCDMRSALQSALPELSTAEIETLIECAPGAPGKAAAFRGLRIEELDQAFAELVRTGDPANVGRSKLAKTLSAKGAASRYEAFLARLPAAIAAEGRARRGEALAKALDAWDRAIALAARARALSLDAGSTVFELAGLLAGLGPASASRQLASP